MMKYKVWRLPGDRRLRGPIYLLEIEALLNGRPNSEGAKVAKFLAS